MKALKVLPFATALLLGASTVAIAQMGGAGRAARPSAVPAAALAASPRHIPSAVPPGTTTSPFDGVGDRGPGNDRLGASGNEPGNAWPRRLLEFRDAWVRRRSECEQ